MNTHHVIFQLSLIWESSITFHDSKQRSGISLSSCESFMNIHIQTFSSIHLMNCVHVVFHLCHKFSTNVTWSLWIMCPKVTLDCHRIEDFGANVPIIVSPCFGISVLSYYSHLLSTNIANSKWLKIG